MLNMGGLFGIFFAKVAMCILLLHNQYLTIQINLWIKWNIYDQWCILTQKILCQNVHRVGIYIYIYRYRYMVRGHGSIPKDYTCVLRFPSIFTPPFSYIKCQNSVMCIVS
jgi:hypothetical protein